MANAGTAKPLTKAALLACVDSMSLPFAIGVLALTVMLAAVIDDFLWGSRPRGRR